MSGSRTAPVPVEAGRPGPAVSDALRDRAEVRDLLAWLRLLLDPHDASAVVRALGRPPVEMRQVDVARVIQVARRRKLDLVAGLSAAVESPQVPPEARERIGRFLSVHRAACADLVERPPGEFLDRLIDRLSAPGRLLLAPERDAQRQASMRQVRELASEFLAAGQAADARALARHLAVTAPPSDGGVPATRDEVQPAVAQEPGAEITVAVEEALASLRAEVLEGVARIGGRLGELRLDTDLDIAHGVVSYLELLKLSAVLQRGPESVADALADVNARLRAAATPLQREILDTSPLDEALLAGDRAGLAGAAALAPREGRSLQPFIPRKGAGLALSASDIETYRRCPLHYKFARVLRIPTEQTPQQRFGIVVHQVLERWHSTGGTTIEGMLMLLDGAWGRSGLGTGDDGGALLDRARTALCRYHARLASQDTEPVWFERQFSFRLGPHHLRGRVDRVDRVAGEDCYELIDYKTSRPKTPEELEDDLQLSLYALAAREDWQLSASRQAYYYVLDDVKVPVPSGERADGAVTDIVMEVGEGILAQDFEPTPSPAACRICDHRIVCPASEA